MVGEVSERRRELEWLMSAMTGLMLYDMSLKPRAPVYKYCRKCRVFFNGDADLRRCPLCSSKLRQGRARGAKRYIDPARYGVVEVRA